MKKFFALVVLTLGPVVFAAHPAAENGSAKMVIVYEKVADPQSCRWDFARGNYNTGIYAAKKLAGYLKNITGAEFKCIPEAKWDKKTPAFIIGNTAYARQNGIDVKKLQPEEWLYRSAGKNIIFAGGVNFGQVIAINKFAEDILNCRYLAFDCKIFPKKTALVLPESSRRGQPDFLLRTLYTPIPREKVLRKKFLEFHRFNRNTIWRGDSEIQTRQFSPAHTLYYYVNPDKYFKSNPEYFSMNEKGKRFCGSFKTRKGGQICFSNPQVAKIAAASLREFIKRDRKKYQPVNYPTVYSIQQLDSTSYMCLCSECKKITAREGSDSGLLLTFINAVARNIAKDHPEIIIETAAYSSTERAPKYIKPEKNVKIEWCDLYTRSDCFKSFDHPSNAKQYAILDAWNRSGCSIEYIYDYWNMGGRYIDPPRIETMAHNIKRTLECFYKLGGRKYFVETEHSFYNVDTNFIDLQHYLGLQLLDDLKKDDKKLIAEFIALYYGKGAIYMQEFYDLLTAAMENVSEHLATFVSIRPYQTADFVRKVYSLLEKAHRAVPADSPYQYRIEREILPVLRTMLYYRNLRGDRSKQDVLAEYKKLRMRQLKYIYTPGELKSVMPIVRKELEKLSFVMPVPEKFAHIKRDDLGIFSALDVVNRKPLDDPESLSGKTIRVGGNNLARDAVKHATECNDNKYGKWVFAVSDLSLKSQNRTNLRTKIARDGKYHWYCIRNVQLGANSFFWAWGQWIKIDICSFYRDGMDNRCDVWFSLKAVGPSYVKNSKQEDNFFLDCVVLTPPGAVK